MYLVTLYFDEKTNRTLQRYIDRIAERTGNPFMVEHHVPPHLTISQIEARNEEMLLSGMETMCAQLRGGSVELVSVGIFLPYVLQLTAVYNQDLHRMMEQVHETFGQVSDTKISARYQPMSFVPHVTLGKTLTKEQMLLAVSLMQDQFVPFRGRFTEIGLSKVNPYRDLIRYPLG